MLNESRRDDGQKHADWTVPKNVENAPTVGSFETGIEMAKYTQDFGYLKERLKDVDGDSLKKAISEVAKKVNNGVGDGEPKPFKLLWMMKKRFIKILPEMKQLIMMFL